MATTITVWPKTGYKVPKERGGYYAPSGELVTLTTFVQGQLNDGDILDHDPGLSTPTLPPIPDSAIRYGVLSSQLSGYRGLYDGATVVTVGRNALGDGLGANFSWDEDSVLAEDGINVFGTGSVGRWRLAGTVNPVGSIRVQVNGSPLPARRYINMIGVTGVDNSVADSTDLTYGFANRLTVSSSGTISDLNTQGANIIEFTSASSKTITSMVPTTLPVYLVNRGAGTLSIANNSGGTATNRIAPIANAQIDLALGGTALCWYDTNISRWLAVNLSGTAAVITPLTLGMTWYRPDPDKVTTATGISQLVPMNGATNLTQGTAGYQPAYVTSDAAFNNKPVISFDGTDDRLVAGALLNLRPITIWWVGSWAGGGGVVCGQYYATSFQFASWNATTIGWQEGAGAPTSAHAGYPASFCITADSGTGIIFYRNGAQIGTATQAIAASGAGSNFGMGADHTGAGAAQCKIADFAFKAGVMTPTEIASLTTSYTTGRYGF